ncbi:MULTISPECIES: ABC transporter permease [Pseudomonas syringae group]|uniref:Peptide ABC transporter, permease protein n=2 Tax=Pseudomonas syringae group genomosp. 3 TaxID=251701 RepID=Q881S2_PSESM|nr:MULTISPECIES: ABC transporter permease [Pseudomonas syringae group]KPC08136.1 Peptide ABC transporter [Pseudomonas amygdali pv. lachrymans]AAO56310.1 peptide ABC transporter, permease protein [Pseudomonas syringae pv. tomato str. DC3000]EGH94319.1 peptide ABC transporter, permease protein [Pseudomonas amygdali pv. lachrymans str. M302278]KKI26093.1 ABC transporter permease [Pseudomonas syringae pv. persicae]KPB89394.1 Peptide ABC transporter [Pseudomonas syringae pv. maculicola]
MIGWALRRLTQSLLVILLMTVVVFVGLNAIGNPMDILVGEDLNQAERLQAIADLGLDQPLWQQYLIFLKGAMHGNLGQSFVYHEDAMRLILQRLPATFELAFSALFLAVVIGVPLGMFAGMYPDHPLSRLMMAASIVGFSLPAFWVALMMIMLFSITLGWLPASGRGETREWLGVQWSWLTLDGLQHLLLPALNLALFKISLVLRLTRAGVREVLPQEFVKFARAKGLSPMRVMCMHVMRNTMIPVVTVLAMELGSTIAYAVVTESIFAWPGAGKLILDSINMLDRPVVVAYLMVVVVIFVVLNLIVDGLYYLLDPRVRIEASR